MTQNAKQGPSLFPPRFFSFHSRKTPTCSLFFSFYLRLKPKPNSSLSCSFYTTKIKQKKTGLFSLHFHKTPGQPLQSLPSNPFIGPKRRCTWVPACEGMGSLAGSSWHSRHLVMLASVKVLVPCKWGGSRLLLATRSTVITWSPGLL